MASYGTRGDVEPAVAVGCELQRRGHDVTMAVPPDLLDFAEGVGLSALPYGRTIEPQLDAYRDAWATWAKHFWRIPDLVALCRDALVSTNQQWAEMGKALMSLADGADLLSTGVGFEQPAANVADFYGIPLVALHTMPWRPNGQIFPLVPALLTRRAMVVYDWLGWRLTKKAEDAQRRELDLPNATAPTPRRMADRGWMEIQVYDEVSVPGLAAEWSRLRDRRPFVGALTMELTTAADAGVREWIAAGEPPICFAFGSIPLESPAETVDMISTACARLGQRALVCAGGTDLSEVRDYDHVKVVRTVNYAATFPACRAIVHHGGSGTTAASLRSGIPALILWSVGDQPMWGMQLKRLKAGSTRRFSATTLETLTADLRRILLPECAVRARAVAARMSSPAESVSRTADLMELAASR
jgi:UDP:flavonoid glycosyltransferase YjiC (YdhE family)